MHCLSCDCELSDQESVRKRNDEYVDLCNHCYYLTFSPELVDEIVIGVYQDEI